MPRLIPITDWPHIDPGKKRHKINICATGSTTDIAGQESPALGAVVWSCRAAIESTIAEEQFQEGFVSQVVHKIYVNWPRSVRITADMSVVVYPLKGPTASVFKIQAIENVQQRDLVMILTCIEINNQQESQT